MSADGFSLDSLRLHWSSHSIQGFETFSCRPLPSIRSSLVSFACSLLAPMSFQTCMIYFLLCNKRGEMLKYIHATLFQTIKKQKLTSFPLNASFWVPCKTGFVILGELFLQAQCHHIMLHQFLSIKHSWCNCTTYNAEVSFVFVNALVASP